MAFKFIHFTDTHYTGKNPESRKDILLDTALNKTEEIIDVAIEEEADAVCHTGDFFDSPNIGDSVAGRVGSTYKRFPCPVLVIPGQHDLIGHNLSTLDQTKLGLLGKLGIVKILQYEEKYIIEKNGKTVQITGSPYDVGSEKNNDLFIVREKVADRAIHMAHALPVDGIKKLTPKKQIQKETLADVTLSGDFHLGFEPCEFEGKVFINPGAAVRKYNLIEEVERMPYYTIITIDNDMNVSYELRPFKCAVPGNMALDREKVEIRQQYEEQLMKVKQGIMKSRDRQLFTTDLEKIIRFIASTDVVEDEVISEALIRIDEAKRLLGIE